MKFYAVKKGHNPGVYLSWPSCQEQVRGFSGAIFKSFTTRKEAEDFVTVNLRPEKPDRVFFTDGSFRNGKSGGAAVDVYAKKIHYRSLPHESKDQSNNRGELLGLILALEHSSPNESIIINTDSQYAINILQSGYAASDNLDMIGRYKHLKEEKKLTIYLEYVKAHCGIQYNELADKYAAISLDSNPEITTTIDM